MAGTCRPRWSQLVHLPGVGRKTANVVLGTAFGKATGVVVDTHVTRIAQRLGMTREKTAERIEQDLMAVLPRKSPGSTSRIASFIMGGRSARPASRSVKCARCSRSVRVWVS